MPFNQQIKSRMFVRCARICCLCWKQCGTNIEAAHIRAEASGGPNEEENGIPVCFDCHQEIGAYDNTHPRGNKFTPDELRARRDDTYRLVESGAIQAQVIAGRMHRERGSVGGSPAQAASEARPPSEEARAVLEEALGDWPPESIPSKLALLSENDRAAVIDGLIEAASKGKAAGVLMGIVERASTSDEAQVVVERLLRRLALVGDSASKAAFMENVPLQMLLATDQDLRRVFFEGVVETMQRDQFDEVNKITPAVTAIHGAIPPELENSYLDALLSQACSAAWSGGPAAGRAILEASEGQKKVMLSLLTMERLIPNAHYCDRLKAFIRNTRDLWPEAMADIYQDLLTLEGSAFLAKHMRMPILPPPQ